MIELDFKSQICTTREQSERLIALGLKKETADMTHHYLHSIDGYEVKDVEFSRIMHLQELVNTRPVMGLKGDDMYGKDIPAWSFARLLEIFLTTGGYRNILFVSKGDHMAYLVEQIRRYILEGFLDKRFLED